MGEKVKKEAEKIIELFERNHVIITKNSKGDLIAPYKSGFVCDRVVKRQTKKFAIIYCDGKLETAKNIISLYEGCGMVNSDLSCQPIDLYKQIKEYIETNY